MEPGLLLALSGLLEPQGPSADGMVVCADRWAHPARSLCTCLSVRPAELGLLCLTLIQCSAPRGRRRQNKGLCAAGTSGGR